MYSVLAQVFGKTFLTLPILHAGWSLAATWDVTLTGTVDHELCDQLVKLWRGVLVGELRAGDEVNLLGPFGGISWVQPQSHVGMRQAPANIQRNICNLINGHVSKNGFKFLWRSIFVNNLVNTTDILQTHSSCQGTGGQPIL